MFSKKTSKIISYNLLTLVIFAAIGFCPMRTSATSYQVKPVALSHNCNSSQSNTNLQRSWPKLNNCCLTQNNDSQTGIFLNKNNNFTKKLLTFSEQPVALFQIIQLSQQSLQISNPSPPAQLRLIETTIKRE